MAWRFPWRRLPIPALRAVMVLALVATVSLAAVPATAAEHEVQDFGDQPLDAPGQLRTLIRAALPGDVIRVPAGTVSLVLSGQNEDLAAQGDLDVTKPLTIVGAGPGLTVIDAAGRDRVFEVRPGASLTLVGLTVRGGRDPGETGQFGGGVAVSGNAALFLRDVVIRDNRVAGSTLGGGLSVAPGGVAELEGVTLTENFGGIGGGGIAIEGTLHATNVTISGNSVDQEGSGLSVNGGPVTLAGVTITGNQGLGAGPSSTVRIFSGTVAARQLVIGANSGALHNDCGGALVATGPIFIELNGCAVLGALITGGPPGLGSLGDNGGSTPTHLPQAGSPLINAGGPVCPRLDQRGVQRPQGDACDVGAVEVAGPGPPPPPPGSVLFDFDGDGRPDLVVAAGRGDEPLVKVLSGATGAELASFRAYDSPYRGGVRVAVCDLTGDGTPDIVTATASGPALIRAFDGAAPGTPLAGALGGFLAFPAGARPLGATIACVDLSGDGVPDFIVGPGPGGDGQVRTFSGVDASPLGAVTPFPGSRSEVWVGP